MTNIDAGQSATRMWIWPRMFDGILRKGLDPAINATARQLAPRITAEQMTFLGLAAGLACAAAIGFGYGTLLALACLALSRVADGLDGAIARQTKATPRGAFLDIVCDFIFYGAIPLAFALHAPALNAIPAVVLLFAFYVNGASFLAYAAVAAGKGMTNTTRGTKGLHYTAGLAEGGETIACFAVMILWPSLFPVLAYAFAALCMVTALARMLLAWRSF
jgi:phosphatidylglycerophosphate synthase